MSKMAQFAYIYGIASPSPSRGCRERESGSGAGGNFSAVLHNDGDGGGCSLLAPFVGTGQIGYTVINFSYLSSGLLHAVTLTNYDKCHCIRHVL